MEKLLELMNDYAHTYADHYDDTGREIEIKFLEHTDNCFIYYCDWKFDGLVDDTVISKRFGFIGRLVKNDKIDFDGIQNVFYRNKRYKEYRDYSDYESLLMLLAIQDNPIDFLISILK